MKRLHTFAACGAMLLSILFVLPGCEIVSPEDSKTVVRDLTEAEARVVEADNRFGVNLFRAVSEADAEQNIFISPLSVSMALGMTLNGAEGETYDEIRDVLELNGLSEKEINEAYRTLIDLLKELDPKVAFEIANSIWYRQGFEVQQEFLDVNRSSFDAEIRGLDFGSDDAADTINRWVDDKTRGKIDEIVDRIGGDVVMYLINAIYFNGTWTYRFDEDLTREMPFNNFDGTESTVPMMSLHEDLPYLITERFTAVDLPYGDSLYSMTVLLPNEGYDVHSLASSIDPASWNGRFQTGEVHLKLPRFSFDYEIEMNDVLSALGMDSAFDPDRADFTRINPAADLYISKVKHKAFVEVDEEGTEAAAATSVEVSLTSISGINFPVDRPFVFVIRERHSDTVLFMGRVLHL